MLKKNSKSKYIKFFIFNFLIFGVLISVSVVGGYYIQKIQTKNKNLMNTVENEWRNNCHQYLKSIEKMLEKDILNDKLNVWNDDNVTKWIKENIVSKNYNDKIKSVKVVNIGYSPNTWDDKRFIKVKEKYKLNDNEINNYIKEICSSYDIDKKSNSKIEYDIISMANQISINKKMDKDDIVNLLQYMFFIKNKSILNASLYSNGDLNYKNIIENHKKITDCEGNWIEWIIVPDGVLGFNDEPKYNNEYENIKFKKLLIMVSIDKENVLKPYYDLSREMNQMKYFINFILILALLSSIILITLRFYSIINSENSGGGLHDNRYSDDDFYKLIYVILYKPK